jgi:hypothetical protein
VSSVIPESGIIGLPPGVKEAGKRVDVRPDDLTFVIETKGGRIAWSRAAVCPCEPINDQTDQPDPNCSLCKGLGWTYFQPTDAVTQELGEITALQQRVIGTNSSVIRGLMSGSEIDHDSLEVIGRPWMRGQYMLTVRAENKIGFYDRITHIDATVVYSQKMKALEDTTAPLNTRYELVALNLLRSVDKVFEYGVDFTINDQGQILWETGKAPAKDTTLSVHYLTMPTWLVMTHPHATRKTLQKFKKKRLQTPRGDSIDLPIQALIQYEFLHRPNDVS